MAKKPTGLDSEQANAGVESEAISEVKAYSLWLFSSLLDALFVVGWVLLQWGTNWTLSFFTLKGIDASMLLIFQWVFAITTLVPILAHVIRNVTIIVFRVVKLIAKEMYNLKSEIREMKTDATSQRPE